MSLLQISELGTMTYVHVCELCAISLVNKSDLVVTFGELLLMVPLEISKSRFMVVV